MDPKENVQATKTGEGVVVDLFPEGQAKRPVNILEELKARAKAGLNAKRVVIELSPSGLATLLQLPPGTALLSVEKVDHDKEGFHLLVKVGGVGVEGEKVPITDLPLHYSHACRHFTLCWESVARLGDKAPTMEWPDGTDDVLAGPVRVEG